MAGRETAGQGTADRGTAAPIIAVRDLSKWFTNGFVRTFVLRNVDLEVRRGEFVSIMGPSGSGKSTLLHILGLLDDSSDGEYRFLGEEVQRSGEKRRAELHKRHIGFVFQSYHLLDDLTVYENIEMPLVYRDVRTSERRALVGDVLDRFQIVGKRDLFPSQLSGGQQQIVGVARAVIGRPDLILADEPTGNLNSEQGLAIMDLFRKLNEEGTTIVQVTHSEANAARGNRIVRLLDGRVQ
jgi:ABC-type lipoprotein export system ATPase subunit